MARKPVNSASVVLKNLSKLLPDLEPLYKDIHAHPELSMHETRTADIAADNRQLQGNGVVFERFGDFMKQDDLGIWTAPDGTKVAWFKDPDGNILSLSQHAQK